MPERRARIQDTRTRTHTHTHTHTTVPERRCRLGITTIRHVPEDQCHGQSLDPARLVALRARARGAVARHQRCSGSSRVRHRQRERETESARASERESERESERVGGRSGTTRPDDAAKSAAQQPQCPHLSDTQASSAPACGGPRPRRRLPPASLLIAWRLTTRA